MEGSDGQDSQGFVRAEIRSKKMLRSEILDFHFRIGFFFYIFFCGEILKEKEEKSKN